MGQEAKTALSLELAKKPSRVEEQKLNSELELFLLEGTIDLPEKHDLAWFKQNQVRLRNELVDIIIPEYA